MRTIQIDFCARLVSWPNGSRYYARKVSIEVAKDPRADFLVSAADDRVSRKDGTGHVYDTRYYVDHARTSPEMIDALKRVWIVGSLIAVGDALSGQDYLTHAPILQLLYHGVVWNVFDNQEVDPQEFTFQDHLGVVVRLLESAGATKAMLSAIEMAGALIYDSRPAT